MPDGEAVAADNLNSFDCDDLEDACEPDVCTHGNGFDVICVECCPEDDDGSFTGDEWS